MRYSVLWKTVRFGTVGVQRLACFFAKEPALSADGPGGPPKGMKNRGGLLRSRRRGKVRAPFALDQLRPSLSLTWNVRF